MAASPPPAPVVAAELPASAPAPRLSLPRTGSAAMLLTAVGLAMMLLVA